MFLRKFAVANGSLNVFRADAVGIFRERGKQRLVGDQVDAPGQAAGDARDFADDGIGKQVGAAVTGGAQAEHQVFAGFLRGQRFQPKAVSDAFFELADPILTQVVIKFGLAEQHDLQQLVGLGFQVGQQADFLQRGDRHALRFLDEQHHAFAFSVALQQIGLNGMHHHQPARVAGDIELHFEGNGVEDFLGRDTGVRQINRDHLFRQPALQHAAEHRFTAADFAGDLDDALALGDRVNQCLEDRTAVAAAEKEIGVRCDLERRLGQSEVLVIHGYLFSPVSPWDCIRL